MYKNRLNNLKNYSINTGEFSKFPSEPGVYIFKNSNGNIIYIGKSRKLKSRLWSYLAKDIPNKTKQMISEAEKLSYIRVGSELEALLLEARLVKEFQPKYNIELKDDKNPLYIVITKEKYPRVLTNRKISYLETPAYIYGPFPSSTNVKHVILLLRKLFPFSQHTLADKPCFYNQIGLCNPCPNIIENLNDAEEKRKLFNIYRNNIRIIRSVLDGKLKIAKNFLEKEMTKMSNKQEYEQASNFKIKLDMLNYITQPRIPVGDFIDNPNLLQITREEELEDLMLMLQKYYPFLKSVQRLECYDIAHLSGTFPTASMVTFIHAEAEKSLYRHFKINNQQFSDDYAAMKEVASRRKKYLSTWGIPDLVIVDGGKGQVNAFKTIFDAVNIPVIGLAKRFETLVIPFNNVYFLEPLPPGPAKNLMQRIRNEAHRFARRYHHLLVEKSLIDDK